MHFVHLILPFTAALFVIRVICTFFRLIFSFFSSSCSLILSLSCSLVRCFFFISFLFEIQLHLLWLHSILHKCSLELNKYISKMYTNGREVTLQQYPASVQMRSQKACIVPCHFHLVAIFDIFHGIYTIFGITKET